ncbi:DUF1002 domain-containing protein [Ornithinibacillus bavariensis]|uniref:DUF1002 domain-containing protein n=1 Tax=Ornithinibacillus bavariensis TaxID=545502 RepID=A0A919X824_9BACI|nr:DUF1002 domain-containing protein [Ornithinibacillus bavariensis]GIO26744.1 hypothetical protein J43TS3_13550 [Ornithinibacillus bavariensis]HAM80807.1 DUF1002 domain-containing protein [Ornithinibacillus sp.]
MKQYIKLTALFTLIISLLTVFVVPVSADEGINEKLGVPIVVYGGNLTDDQKTQTKKLLEVTDSNMVDEYTVTGEDLAKYIGGNSKSRMFSSAKITIEEEGKGLNVSIITPENITEVTSEMYANALLTAGVENASVVVASPVKVSGHSALTGIYKAYDEEGAQLDKERMALANEELNVATDLVSSAGLSKEQVSELITQIKQAIAEQNPATVDDIERIVKEQLDKLEISLSEKDRQMLIDLFEKMRDLNINFDQVKSQLNDIASKVQNKIEDLIADEGFWDNIGNFFKQLFDAISKFFANIFG